MDTQSAVDEGRLAGQLEEARQGPSAKASRTLYDMYDASLHPREERPSLDLLDRRGTGATLGPLKGGLFFGGFETRPYALLRW